MPIVALPALADVAIAAICLICLLAIAFLIEALANALSHTPVIGGWVSSTLRGLSTDVRNAGSKVWDGGMHGLRVVFETVTSWWHDFESGMVGWISTAANAVDRLWTVYLPSFHAGLDRDINNVEARAEAYAVGKVNALAAVVGNDVRAVTATADSLFNSAVSHADAIRDELLADLAGDIGKAEALAAAALTAEAAKLSASITAAEHLAQSEVTALSGSVQGAIDRLTGDVNAGLATAEVIAATQLSGLRSAIYTDLAAWGDEAVSVAWPDSAGDINALRQALGGDFPWLNDLLGALGGAATAGLLGTLIRSMAGTQALTRLATDCTVPTCRDISGFGSELQNLLGVVTGAAFFAWIAEGVTNPSGWADEANSYLGPIFNGVASEAKSAFGVG